MPPTIPQPGTGRARSPFENFPIIFNIRRNEGAVSDRHAYEFKSLHALMVRGNYFLIKTINEMDEPIPPGKSEEAHFNCGCREMLSEIRKFNAKASNEGYPDGMKIFVVYNEENFHTNRVLFNDYINSRGYGPANIIVCDVCKCSYYNDEFNGDPRRSIHDRCTPQNPGNEWEWCVELLITAVQNVLNEPA